MKNSFLISKLNLPSFVLKPLPLVLLLHSLTEPLSTATIGQTCGWPSCRGQGGQVWLEPPEGPALSVSLAVTFIFSPRRWWPTRSPCWCRACGEASLSQTAPAPSWLSSPPARTSCRYPQTCCLPRAARGQPAACHPVSLFLLLAARWEDGSCCQGHRAHHHRPGICHAAQPVCQKPGCGPGRAPHGCTEGERLVEEAGTALFVAELPAKPLFLLPTTGTGGLRAPGDRLGAGLGAEPGEGPAGGQGSRQGWQAQTSARRDGEGAHRVLGTGFGGCLGGV